MQRPVRCDLFFPPCIEAKTDGLNNRYNKDPDRLRYPYERELVRYLQKIVDDLDKRYASCSNSLFQPDFFYASIKKGLERLSHQQPDAVRSLLYAKSRSPNFQLSQLPDSASNDIDLISEKTEMLLKEVHTQSH